jgi:hypothetical protein
MMRKQNCPIRRAGKVRASVPASADERRDRTSMKLALIGSHMKSIANCRVMVVSLLALNGVVASAEAKTIVVDSLNAAVLVRPASHFAVRTLAESHSDAKFGSLSAAIAAPMHTARLRSPAEDTSMLAPVQQSDFRAMLLVGAVLVAQQLRRKHRSLKQSLIAG